MLTTKDLTISLYELDRFRSSNTTNGKIVTQAFKFANIHFLSEIFSKINNLEFFPLLEELTKHPIEKEFHDAIEFFEKYTQIRIKIPIPSISHDKIIKRLEEKLADRYKVDLLDGVKVMFNDDSWALIRKSNTEDIIRLSLESNDVKFVKDKQREITDLVNESYEEIK